MDYLTIFPSADKKKLIEKILDALLHDKIDLNDLLSIAQYDIRSRRFQGFHELKRALRKVSNAIGYKRERLERNIRNNFLYSINILISIRYMIY